MWMSVPCSASIGDGALLPDAAKHLFAVTELKLQAQPLGVRKIEAGPQGGRLLFQPEPPVDPLRPGSVHPALPPEVPLGAPVAPSASYFLPPAWLARHTC